MIKHRPAGVNFAAAYLCPYIETLTGAILERWNLSSLLIQRYVTNRTFTPDSKYYRLLRIDFTNYNKVKSVKSNNSLTYTLQTAVMHNMEIIKEYTNIKMQ